MEKKRRVPFGYMIANGKIHINEAEAKAVSMIFEQYASGSSMLTITRIMSQEGIPFSAERPVWNKGMVKRIIENPKYLGQDMYPKIIESDLFEKANAFRSRKERSVVLNTIPEDIKTMYKMTYCKECGSRLTRTSERWTCRNPECSEFSFAYTDQMLSSAVLNILNSCIANTDLLESGGQVSEYKPSIDVLRKQNEINLMLDSADMDMERIKSELYALAELKYDCCHHNDKHCKTEQLQKLLGSKEQLNTIDNGLLIICVKRITVSHFCTTEVEFVNGITIENITERRNDNA